LALANAIEVPTAEAKGDNGMVNKVQKTRRKPQRKPQRSDDDLAAQEIDRILARLDVGIAEERKQMDELLARLRTTRIAA